MSSVPIPIYQGQDFYVPTFQVKLEGRKPGEEVIRDIQEVTYKDDIEQVDSFEITINNWDADTLSFKYSDLDLFNPGKKVELWMGYHGRDALRLMIKGEITALRPNFPASGQPTLAISGLNVMHTLRKKQESHAYIKLKDSTIAKQIGGRLGVNIKTDPNAEAAEQKLDYLIQHNQYDIVFLMERARRIGYDLFVEESGSNGSSQPTMLHFRPSVNVRQTVYELTWGKSLMQFQPTLTTAKQVGTVVVKAWSTTEKGLIEATATRDGIKTKGVGSTSARKSSSIVPSTTRRKPRRSRRRRSSESRRTW
jgi:Bacteriophage probable baseplate hub protein